MLPKEIKLANKTTYRSLIIENEVFEFSDGFSELHTQSYQDIINGKGFLLSEVKNSIELVHNIRTKKT